MFSVSHANELENLLKQMDCQDGLFSYKDRVLHSGRNTNWKIDCDSLTDQDISVLAKMIVNLVGEFGLVLGIPSGGLRLEAALKEYEQPYSNRLLVVDDVMTTGLSFRRFINDLPDDIKSGKTQWGRRPTIIGACIFSRCSEGRAPHYVTPLFKVNESLSQVI